MTEPIYVNAVLPSGNTITVPVQATSAVSDVAFKAPKIARDLLDGIRELGELVREAASRHAPDSFEIALSVGFEVKAGQVVALLAEGAANGSVTLTLSWDTVRSRQDGTQP